MTVHRATAADAVSPNSSCASKEYGYTGYRVCGFDWSSADWGGGNVGTSSSERTTTSTTYIGNGLGIETIGTDNRWHCNDRRSGNWSGWYTC